MKNMWLMILTFAVSYGPIFSKISIAEHSIAEHCIAEHSIETLKNIGGVGIWVKFILTKNGNWNMSILI